MFEFEIIGNIAMLSKYRGQDDHVVVPELYKGRYPVQIIGEAAFSHTHISSVLLPCSVTMIRRNAFIGCGFLEWVGFGSEQESLENGISVIKAKIGEGAFYGTKLRDVIITGDNDISIGSYAFANSKVCNVQIAGDKPVSLGSNCFSHSGLETIVLPTHNNKLDVIPKQCFAGCVNLRNVRFSASRIGDEAFLGCNSLQTMPLYEGLKRIGASAFGQCSGLKMLKIPKTLEYFSPDAFAGTSIAHFEVHSENQYFSGNEDGAILSRGGDALLAFPPATTGTLILQDGVQRIGKSAFLGSHLRHIELPSTLTTIEKEAFRGSNIVEITLPENLATIAADVFSHCHNLYEVTIPRGLNMDVEDIFYNALIKVVHYQGSPAEFENCLSGEFLDEEEMTVWFLDEETEKEYQVGTRKSNLLFEYTVYRNGTCRLDKVNPVFNHIVVPSEIDGNIVTNIGGDCVFPLCTDSAYIPDTVREMEFGAFANAPFIKKISVPFDLFIDPIELPSRCEVERRC